MVERAKILFPLSQIGAITEGQRLDLIKQSEIYGKYDTPVDRESAYEILMQEEEASPDPSEGGETLPTGKAAATTEKKKPGVMSKVLKAVLTAITSTLAAVLGTWVSEKVSGKTTKKRTTTKERVVKNATSAATRTLTKELTRDILGNLVK